MEIMETEEILLIIGFGLSVLGLVVCLVLGFEDSQKQIDKRKEKK